MNTMYNVHYAYTDCKPMHNISNIYIYICLYLNHIGLPIVNHATYVLLNTAEDTTSYFY